MHTQLFTVVGYTVYSTV